MTCHDLKICSKIFHSICIWHAWQFFTTRLLGVFPLELALINFAADKAAPLFSEQFSLLGVALLGLKGRKSRIERRAFNLFAFFCAFCGDFHYPSLISCDCLFSRTENWNISLKATPGLVWNKINQLMHCAAAYDLISFRDPTFDPKMWLILNPNCILSALFLPACTWSFKITCFLGLS